MAAHLFVIATHLLAGAFLVRKGIGITAFAYQWVHLWWLSHSPGRRLSLIDSNDLPIRKDADPFSLVGSVLGIGSVLFLVRHIQNAGWLLPALVLLGFGLERLTPSREQIILPEVITFLSIYRAAVGSGYATFDALKLALSKLPSGQVKETIEEALHLHRRGLPTEKCLAPLSRCSQHLADFVSLHESGSPANKCTPDLSTILRRARWEQYLSHPTYLFLKKAQVFTQPLRSFVLGGIAAVLWIHAPQLNRSIAGIWSAIFA